VAGRFDGATSAAVDGSASGFAGGGTIGTDDAAMPCVSFRGDETPIVRKTFLVQDTSAGASRDWIAHIRIVSATPDVGSLQGAEWTGSVRFSLTIDKVQLSANVPMMPGSRDPQQVDWWSGTDINVSPGCIPSGNMPAWQVRDWIRWDFDKSDLSDLAPFEPADASTLHECVKSATNVHVTLVPGSFGESETAGTMQWSESITASMTCPSFVGMPLTMALDYSFTLP
jgi:hypothetical protein